MSKEEGNADSGPREDGAPGKKDSGDIYENRGTKKIVRLITVLAYMFSVSFVAIVLSAYYLFLWEPPNPRLIHRPHRLRAEPRIEFFVAEAPRPLSSPAAAPGYFRNLEQVNDSEAGILFTDDSGHRSAELEDALIRLRNSLMDRLLRERNESADTEERNGTTSAGQRSSTPGGTPVNGTGRDFGHGFGIPDAGSGSLKISKPGDDNASLIPGFSISGEEASGDRAGKRKRGPGRESFSSSAGRRPPGERSVSVAPTGHGFGEPEAGEKSSGLPAPARRQGRVVLRTVKEDKGTKDSLSPKGDRRGEQDGKGVFVLSKGDWAKGENVTGAEDPRKEEDSRGAEDRWRGEDRRKEEEDQSRKIGGAGERRTETNDSIVANIYESLAAGKSMSRSSSRGGSINTKSTMGKTDKSLVNDSYTDDAPRINGERSADHLGQPGYFVEPSLRNEVEVEEDSGNRSYKEESLPGTKSLSNNDSLPEEVRREQRLPPKQDSVLKEQKEPRSFPKNKFFSNSGSLLKNKSLPQEDSLPKNDSYPEDALVPDKNPCPMYHLPSKNDPPPKNKTPLFHERDSPLPASAYLPGFLRRSEPESAKATNPAINSEDTQAERITMGLPMTSNERLQRPEATTPGERRLLTILTQIVTTAETVSSASSVTTASENFGIDPTPKSIESSA